MGGIKIKDEVRTKATQVQNFIFFYLKKICFSIIIISLNILYYRKEKHTLNFNINKLIFQDNEIEIFNIEEINTEKGNKLIIKFKNINPAPPSFCERCGCINFGNKDYYHRKIKHINILDNIECELEFKQKRFKCLECGKTFNEVTSIVKKSARISETLKEKIIKECNYGRNVIDVALTNGVSDTTINTIYGEIVNVKRKELPEIMCMDEFSGPATDGKLIFIMVDPIKSEIIDLLPSRKQTYLMEYFHKIEKKEREKAKYVVTDLCPIYVNVIKNMFPKAKHIADRFHWIRIVTNAVQNIRIIAMKYHLNIATKEAGNNYARLKYNEHFILYKLLKTHYRLLNFNTHHGPQEHLRYEGHIYGDNHRYTNQEILEKIINSDNDLDEAYTYLQKLYYIMYNVTYDEARKAINSWCEEIKKSKNKNIYPLKQAVNTIEEWEPQIINSFIISEEIGGNITNGSVEAKNNMIKTIIKNSNGIKNFKMLRAKVLETEKSRKNRR